jgi:rfaE bifunctional protein kinase chain/domain
MATSKKQLLSALEKMQGVPVLVVGDIILDRYLWGAVSRISPEAPVPIVEVRKTEDRLGGAGNTAANLAALGAQVTMCGYVGNDQESAEIQKLLTAQGISVGGLFIDANRPTSLKTRVVAHHQQVCRVDREDTSPREEGISLQFVTKVHQFMSGSKAVVLSDYGKGCISPDLIAMFEEARIAGGIELHARPLVVDPHPANYGIYQGMSVAKPNRKEAEVATGIKISNKSDAVRAAVALLGLWKADMMMITLGEDGLVIAFADGSEPVLLDTRARQVFDVSGAGDTVTAIFTAAIASGSSPRIAGELANIGAGIVVSEIGTVAIQHDKMRREIEESYK